MMSNHLTKLFICIVTVMVFALPCNSQIIADLSVKVDTTYKLYEPNELFTKLHITNNSEQPVIIKNDFFSLYPALEINTTGISSVTNSTIKAENTHLTKKRLPVKEGMVMSRYGFDSDTANLIYNAEEKFLSVNTSVLNAKKYNDTSAFIMLAPKSSASINVVIRVLDDPYDIINEEKAEVIIKNTYLQFFIQFKILNLKYGLTYNAWIPAVIDETFIENVMKYKLP